MDIPDQVAAGMGIVVDEVPVPADWPNGLWLPDQRRIILRHDMDWVTRRCVLAHELGHAHLGHRRTGIPRIDRRQEERADAFAALLLIDVRRYAAAEHDYGPHDAGLAYALDVTPHLIRVWRGEHERQAA